MTQSPGEDLDKARILFLGEGDFNGVSLTVSAAGTGEDRQLAGILFVNTEVYVWLRALLAVGEEVLADELEVRWSVDEYCANLLVAANPQSQRWGTPPLD